MGRHFRNLKFSRATLVPDAMAGFTVALVSIPQAMAFAMVAGVNPVYGLYTGMVTTMRDELTLSEATMVVTLTNALALTFAGCAFHALRRETQPVQEVARRLIELSEQKRLPIFRPYGLINQGWAQALGGAGGPAIAQIRNGLAE